MSVCCHEYCVNPVSILVVNPFMHALELFINVLHQSFSNTDPLDQLVEISILY